MARLVDVARATGLTKSTVSRAFSHPEMVAEATRERILQTAKELDFQPNRVARALSTGKTGMIGLVVPTLANPFFAPIVAGAQRAAEADDRYTLVVVSEYSRQREKTLVARLSRAVDGFVMVSPVGGDRFLRDTAAERAMVLVDRRIGRLPAVLIDTPSGLAAVTARLLADGHRHLGYISGPQSSSWSDAQRLAAVRDAAGAGGAELAVFGPLPPTVDAGLAVAAEVAASHVTAVIGYNSSIALGLITRLGARPGGRKVAVVCADSLIGLHHDVGAEVITLDAPGEKAGFIAMKKLSALLAGGNPRRVHILPTRIIG